MPKKVTVKVEADTTEAKRKLEELAETGGSSAGADAVGGAARRAARELDGAASSAGKLSRTATEGVSNLRAMTKVFGGMAVRMATSYAASNMAEGSAGRTAIDVGGSAVAGALAGSVAGPVGALVGGVMGLTQALTEASAAERERRESLYAVNAANREQLETLLKAEERTEKFHDAIKALTNAEDGAIRRADAHAMLDERRAALARNADDLTGQSAKFQGDDKAFRAAMAERATLKGEISQLESLLERQDPGARTESRVSMAALDALARVGGTFGSGDQGFHDLQRLGEKQVALLEKIEAKTGKRAATF